MRVLVSGAGIAGPTLAYFLAKGGHRITVVEKANDFLAQGQNIDINGSAITIIKKMGLLGEVRKWNTTEKGARIVNDAGETIASLPLEEGSLSPTSTFEILRGDLARLLFSATSDHPNVEYMFGTTIKQVLQNDKLGCKVELSNGQVQDFEVAVAADGQWSRLRKMTFPSNIVSTKNMGMYAAYFTMPKQPEDNDFWTLYLGLDSKQVSTRPDPYGTTRCMLSCTPRSISEKQAWQQASRSDQKTQKEFVKAQFGNIGWQAQRALDALDAAPDFYFQSMQQLRMNKWSSGRVICLGDAAYAPTPLTGMGTSLAIIGAYCLAGELSRLNEDDHDPLAAFQNYEDLFRPFVQRIQHVPLGPTMPRILHPDKSWKRSIIHGLFWIIAKIVNTPFIKKLMGSREDESNDDGFPLPPYPHLEAKSAFER